MSDTSFRTREAGLRSTGTNVKLRADFTSQVPLVDSGDLLQYEYVDHLAINLFISDPDDYDWTELVLVRSASGAPVTIHDGVIVGRYTTVPTQPVLEDNLGAGWYYYALFAKVLANQPPYIRVDTQPVLMPTDWDNATLIWERFPEYYRQLDTSDTFGTVVNELGFDQDITQSMAAGLLDLRNIAGMPAHLLPYMGDMLGVPYEPLIGDARYRALLMRIVGLRQIKGTRPAVAEFVKLLTGCNCSAVDGINLMPSRDESEAATSTGAWQPLRRNTTNGMLVVDATQVALTRGTDGANTWFQVQARPELTGANQVVGMQLDVPADIFTEATARYYLLSLEAQAIGSVITTATIVFQWLRRDGTVATTHTLTPAKAMNTANYTQAFFGAKWSGLGEVPVTLRMQVYSNLFNATGAQGSGLRIRNVMLNKSTSVIATPPAFESARLAKINVYSQRVNLLLNPRFETGVANWTVSGVATMAHDAVGKRMELTRTSADSTLVSVVRSHNIAVHADGLYSVTGVMSSNSTTGRGRVDIEFYNASNQLILGVPGAYQSIVGPATLTLMGKAHPSATSMRVAFWQIDMAQNEKAYLDNAIVEAGTPGPYFDGATDTGALGDFRWEGAPDASRSHYTLNYENVTTRLQALLPEWIPMGRRFLLQFNQVPG